MDDFENQGTNETPEEPAEQESPPQPEVKANHKMIIAAFAAMGAVIIALMTALIITNVGGDKKVKTDDASSVAAEAISKSDEDEADDSDTDGDGNTDTGSSSDKNSDSSGTKSSSSSDPSSAAKSDSKSGNSSSNGGSTGNGGSNNNSSGNSNSSSGSGNSNSSSGSDNQQGGSSSSASGENVVTWSGNNTWENSGVTMTGFECGIKNNTSSAIQSWTLELEIDGLKSVDGWNGTYKISGSKLTVTPADYNKDIQPGGNITLGANLGTTGKLNVKSAKLNGKDVKLVNGTVSQENNQPQQNNNNNNNSNNNNNNNNGQNAQPSSAEVKELIAAPAAASKGDDWLHTDGSRILDKNNKEVWLTGLNWFGYNTGTNLFDGLWNSELVSTVKAIADRGFNLIRVPISAELLLQWKRGEYPKANYNNAYNPTLNAMNSQEIFDYFLRLCCDNGIKVMPDIHSAETNASGHNVNLWCTDKITVNNFYEALEYVADRYKNNDTIIALDLKNEPHGKPNEGSNAAIWNDSKAANNWKYVAETAAARVLAKNPNLLIMVEGTEIYSKKKGDYSSSNSADYYFNWWGGNLRGVAEYPINLGKYQNKLVYSPHDYGPTVYEQPWFQGGYTFDSLMKDCWRDNWFFIKQKNIAPLLIGEWGGFMREPNLTWMTYMRRLIKENHLNHTFWCLNANSGDTGGLLTDNFTDWDEEKYKFVKEVLWQENGKFVGLDHVNKLGSNGITLSNAKGL